MPFWGDEFEILPGGYTITGRDFIKYSRGEAFVIEDENYSAIHIPPGEAIAQEFKYCYDLWRKFFYFGLPGGKGWVNESEWTLEILMLFQDAHEEIQAWRIKKKK